MNPTIRFRSARLVVDEEIFRMSVGFALEIFRVADREYEYFFRFRPPGNVDWRLRNHHDVSLFFFLRESAFTLAVLH